MNWKKKFVRNWGRLGMKCKLSDICVFRKGKVDVSKLTLKTYISTENMLPNKGGVTEASSLPTVQLTQEYKKGDILVSNIRPYFKKIWQAKCDGGCSNDVLVFQGNSNIDGDFLYYILTNDDFFAYSMATSKGTKMPRGDKTSIMQYEVQIFDIDTQRKIASVLRSLDEKIELNSTINNNLEQQAEAIFQSILSNAITTVNLGEIADVKGGKRLPRGVNLIDIPNAHPYIRVRDLNNALFASLTPNYAYVDKETQKSISRYIVSTGDVLISIVGTIGLTAIVDSTLDKANLTENCVKVTNLKHITPEYLLLYLRSQFGREDIAKGTVGAVQQKLPIKNIQAIPIPLLSEKDKNALFCTLDSIFAGISNNVIQSAKLASLRDTLLPRLMSGELDVSDIDL